MTEDMDVTEEDEVNGGVVVEADDLEDVVVTKIAASLRGGSGRGTRPGFIKLSTLAFGISLFQEGLL